MTFPSPPIRVGIERSIVLDTETTGLQSYDKIITLAAMCIEGDTVIPRSLYLIFDPRKDSHPEAAKVHGWDNWTTQFQDLFDDYASEIRSWLSWADKLVMHNAQFDLHYVQREMRKAGQPALDIPSLCTLNAARRQWPGERCGLDECVQRIGIPRRTHRHNALEDTFLTTALYQHMRGIKFGIPIVQAWPQPTNFRTVSPRPEGDLPRRMPKRPGTQAHSYSI